MGIDISKIIAKYAAMGGDKGKIDSWKEYNGLSIWFKANENELTTEQHTKVCNALSEGQEAAYENERAEGHSGTYGYLPVDINKVSKGAKEIYNKICALFNNKKEIDSQEEVNALKDAYAKLQREGASNTDLAFIQRKAISAEAELIYQEQKKGEPETTPKNPEPVFLDEKPPVGESAEEQPTIELPPAMIKVDPPNAPNDDRKPLIE